MAILIQSVWTLVVATTGRYEQILNFVVPIDFLFFGLTATCLFVFRHRDRYQVPRPTGFRVPGHPLTTVLFIAACWLVVANTIYKYPLNSSIGVVILLLGLPVYGYWHRKQRANA